MRIGDMNWSQLEAQLARDDRAVLPLGSTEQHAHLSLATDLILAERMSVEAAEPLGVPVFPVVPYGITPTFMAYPGTVTIAPAHYDALLGDVLESLATHGVRRVLIVNGHGGNKPARPAAEAWADGRGVMLKWHDWWSAPATLAAVRAIDPVASHASWMENFPWTRIDGVPSDDAVKPLVDFAKLATLDPKATRDYLGDGNFGGRARRDDADMRRIWQVAVAETRTLLSGDWT